MSREWKPGDDTAAPIVIDWNGTAVASMLSVLKEHYEPGHRALMSAIRRSNAPSPLAVIDPEDREQVERLSLLHFGHKNSIAADRLQAALREFANPTPPKPEEPLGLGAVVEDAKGSRHVRTFGRVTRAWLGHVDGGERTRTYAEIAAVRVLSEGVQP